jgi:hypothetical protein
MVGLMRVGLMKVLFWTHPTIDQHGRYHAAEGVGLCIGDIAKAGCAGRINNDDNGLCQKPCASNLDGFLIGVWCALR